MRHSRSDRRRLLNIGRTDLILTSNCAHDGTKLSGNSGTTFYAPESNDVNTQPPYASVQFLSANNYNLTQTYTDNLAGDGRLDVLGVGNEGANNGEQLIYARNTGQEIFAFSSLLSAFGVYGSGVGDFNGNGFEDIAVSYAPGIANNLDTQLIGILSGTSNGTFTDSLDFATGPSTSIAGDVSVNDFNGDGRPDIATLVYDMNARTTSLLIFLNTQSASSACAAPGKANTNVICSPGASVVSPTSPVSVAAASNVAGFTLNRLCLDNLAVYNTGSQTVNTPVTASFGTHTLVLVSYNNVGQAFTSTSTFTVAPTSATCPPATAGVSICAPVSNGTTGSPVNFTAGATAAVGNLTALRVYVDNTALFTVNNPSISTSYQFTQSAAVAPGKHNLTVVADESTGAALIGSETFTVAGAPPCYPSSAGAMICSPTRGATTNSSFTLLAGATAASGYITAIRVYSDNVEEALVNNVCDQSFHFACIRHSQRYDRPLRRHRCFRLDE